MRTLPLALASLLLAACGTARRPAAPRPAAATEPSQPVAQFPAPQRVEVATQQEPPDLAALLPRTDPVRVSEWTVESEPAPADPTYAAEDDPFEALIDEVATERGIELIRSASLRCAARELARFYARHEGMPTEDLDGFILAACGSTVHSTTRALSAVRVEGQFPIARFATTSGDELKESLGRAVAADHMHGLGVARVGDKIAAVLVSAPRNAALSPWGPPNELGEVHIEGRLATPGDAVLAYVNQGQYGVQPCRVEPMVQLPNINVRCPMAEGDESALVNLEVVTLGRVMARRAGRLMLRREGVQPVARYVAQDDESPSADPRAALLTVLNAARTAAGVPPLALAEQESEVHARGAPFSAAAAIQDDEDTSEVVGLGMMAGWAVQGGTIRTANHLTQVELGTRSPTVWVEGVLEQPIGRLLLLRPDARQVAIGVVTLDEPRAIVASVSTYAFYEDVDHDADANSLFARIEHERTQRGLPPPRRMRADVLRAQAERVSRGQAQPGVALQIALDQESRRWQRPLSGLRFETVDLDRAPLPDALFARRDLRMGLAVAHTRVHGAAWGQYVVYFMIAP